MSEESSSTESNVRRPASFISGPYPALVFRKSGEEIAQRVAHKTRELHAKNEARQEVIEKIAAECRHPVDVRDAIAEARRKVASAESGGGPVEYPYGKSKSDRPEERLEQEIFRMFSVESEMEQLNRVAKNIERDAFFDLSFPELRELGF